jgi:uncharacterized protein (TIGR03790 family)
MINKPILIAIVVLSCATTSTAHAQDAASVLVVINQTSAQSQEVGAKYIAARHIPSNNVVRIRTAVAETMERRRYEFEIELPIMRAITAQAAQDRILYIVLTKDIPLRILGTSGPRGSVASVDSELTLLYQKLLGHKVLPPGRLPNTYFHADRPITEAKAFSHADQGMYLVTRLDGFTVADVARLIDRGANPVRDGIVVLDERAGLRGGGGDTWLNETADRLAAAGSKERVLFDTTTAVVTDRKPVIGYYSWGSNDPAITRRRMNLGFVPGALAGMFVSTDARTFKEPSDAWNVGDWRDTTKFFEGSPQSLIGDLIREGITGVAGHVAEPYLDATVRPQILFPAYLAGFNLAESFYLAMPFVSWENIVVGDPLCAPFKTHTLSTEDAAPPLDSETELPRFFSARRLAVLEGFGVKSQVARLVLKASAQLSRGDLKKARPSLEEVTKLEPTLNAAHFVLAGLYDMSGEHDLAITRYRTILTTAPDEVRSLNNLAYTLAVNRQAPAEGLPFAEKAYRIAYGNNTQIDLDLGASLIAGRGTPVGALPFALDAYDIFSMKAQISDTLGWIEYLLGNSAAAEKHLAEAGEGAPYSGEVQFHIAAVEAELGRPAQALAALNKAAALDSALAERADVKKLRASLPAANKAPAR